MTLVAAGTLDQDHLGAGVGVVLNIDDLIDVAALNVLGACLLYTSKMLLVALGFKSEIEGFTGANWAVNVNVRANQKGLFDELSINPSEGLTRDNAAQMVWNALDAGVVSYDYTLITDGSSITSSPTLIDNESKTCLLYTSRCV